MRRAQEMAQQVGSPIDVAYVLSRSAASGIGQARWDKLEVWGRPGGAAPRRRSCGDR